MEVQTDTLTGLPNRDALGGALAASVDRADSVALALLDIDRFMGVNADLGREEGDRLLQVLAKLLQEEAPGRAYRVSGDEFAVLMPEQTLEQAFLRMETLRTCVQGATQRFRLRDSREIRITVGVAQYPRDAKDPQGLLKAADSALEAAKENGRNQVGLPPNEDLVMKSCYYPAASLRKLKALAERVNRRESHLLREALSDLIRKYDTPQAA
jgi:diguanylate cyclase (GGDEF)-like protein